MHCLCLLTWKFLDWHEGTFSFCERLFEWLASRFADAVVPARSGATIQNFSPPARPWNLRYTDGGVCSGQTSERHLLPGSHASAVVRMPSSQNSSLPLIAWKENEGSASFAAVMLRFEYEQYLTFGRFGIYLYSGGSDLCSFSYYDCPLYRLSYTWSKF